jgi:excisionase family DNA binding protein
MPKYITIHHAAQRLGVSVWTVYRAIKSGSLPARRLQPRGRYLISEDDLKSPGQPVDHDEVRGLAAEVG